VKRLKAILEILLKVDPDGYLSAYNDTISLGQNLDPSKFSKEDLAELEKLEARWIPASKEIPAGYWVTCW
jgi:hypothetical protein